ncbi:Hypothetical protein, putative [Bodo saltans]|uniref:Membrane-associated protein n=1 Tax=Bodo saltans TaxID=75058 RepID=A0A0S4IIZ2_BODSA|nr:Hypothetical protein, putative [Bodo saltans]|eukprot:CUE73784.1 Hypothetical protein, putative [Bodo saltans]
MKSFSALFLFFFAAALTQVQNKRRVVGYSQKTMDSQVDTFWKHLETYGTSQCNEAQLFRSADILWKAVVAPDGVSTGPSTGGGGASSASTAASLLSSAAANAANSASTAFHKQIEIGRSLLSDTERWKLQAALRREETKVGGKEYNKKVTRATKATKGPTPGEGFPPGRGRPVR